MQLENIPPVSLVQVRILSKVFFHRETRTSLKNLKQERTPMILKLNETDRLNARNVKFRSIMNRL